MESAKIVNVVQTDLFVRGGTEDIPYRRVTRIYSPDGELIAENDEYSWTIERILRLFPDGETAYTKDAIKRTLLGKAG